MRELKTLILEKETQVRLRLQVFESLKQLDSVLENPKGSGEKGEGHRELF